MNIVIDASVSAKWFFRELGTDAALGLLDACEKGTIQFLAPEILSVEMANLIWKKVLRASVDDEYGMAFLERFQQLPITLQPTWPLSVAALRLALRLRHPVYDCFYVALALWENCDFVTADQKLFRLFNPAFDCVRLLSAWSPEAET